MQQQDPETAFRLSGQAAVLIVQGQTMRNLFRNAVMFCLACCSTACPASSDGLSHPSAPSPDFVSKDAAAVDILLWAIEAKYLPGITRSMAFRAQNCSGVQKVKGFKSPEKVTQLSDDDIFFLFVDVDDSGKQTLKYFGEGEIVLMQGEREGRRLSARFGGYFVGLESFETADGTLLYFSLDMREGTLKASSTKYRRNNHTFDVEKNSVDVRARCEWIPQPSLKPKE